jgi:hypothetical protein
MARTDARRSAAQLARDGAIRRIVLTRRFVIAAAAGLTAGIAAFVSAVAPGRTLGATNARYAAAYQQYLAERAHASTASSTKMPPLASPSALGLVAGAAPQAAPAQPQAQAPQAQSVPVQPAPVQSVPVAPPPVVVSGGS